MYRIFSLKRLCEIKRLTIEGRGGAIIRKSLSTMLKSQGWAIDQNEFHLPNKVLHIIIIFSGFKNGARWGITNRGSF